ncbi:MAG: hypothetical protein EA399_16625 [Desulfovibrionales bacterium]|nr:MAG: hypothetical protein EA399_16625 [Desulfovibrionales bacterium]
MPRSIHRFQPEFGQRRLLDPDNDLPRIDRVHGVADEDKTCPSDLRVLENQVGAIFGIHG